MTEPAGRTRIQQRATDRVFRAVTAELLGVPLAEVRVETFDDAGRIGARVTAPVMLPLGPDVGRHTLLEEARAARHGIAERVQRLTGLEIGRVDVRLSAVRTTSPGRVE